MINFFITSFFDGSSVKQMGFDKLKVKLKHKSINSHIPELVNYHYGNVTQRFNTVNTTA